MEATILLTHAETLLNAGDVHLAKRLFHEALKTGEMTIQSVLGMARCYEFEGRRGKAEQCFEDALSVLPRSNWVLAYASFLEEVGDPHKSKQVRETWVRKIKNGSPTLEEDPERLMECCIEVLDLQPLDSWAVIGLIRCAYQTGKFSKAIPSVERLTQREPHSADLLYTLAGLQFQDGQLNTAMDTIRRVFLIEPQHAATKELLRQVVARQTN